jgi:hypothetical protein
VGGFVPGVRLAGEFYAEVVRPLLDAEFPGGGVRGGAGRLAELAARVRPGTRPYYDRPYQVLDAGRFAAALTAAITDPLVRRLGPAGTADQVLDSTPALGDLRYAGAVTSVSGI